MKIRVKVIGIRKMIVPWYNSLLAIRGICNLLK